MNNELSPEMNQTLFDFTRGLDAVARLERRAFTGDATALIALVDLAKAATKAVQGIWFNEAPRTPEPLRNDFTYAKPQGRGYVSTSSRREALHFWCGGLDCQPFPVFAFRDGTELAARQDAMLRGLFHGPGTKGKAHKENPVRFLIEDILRPAFLNIQFGKRPVDGVEAEIFCLEPLTKENVAHWADLAVRWLEKQNRGQLRLHDSMSKLYKIANPEEELRKAIRKRTAVIEKQRKALLMKSGTPTLGIVDQTKYEVKVKEIAGLKVTRAMTRNCLKARILAWLRTNIEDQPRKSPH